MKANKRKQKAPSRKDTLRPEYDFSKGVRGKHSARYAEGTNLVLLEPDVVAEFPTAEEVNEALRSLAHILRRREKSAGRRSA